MLHVHGFWMAQMGLTWLESGAGVMFDGVVPSSLHHPFAVDGWAPRNWHPAWRRHPERHVTAGQASFVTRRSSSSSSSLTSSASVTSCGSVT